jgi:hypothetical protein
MWEIFHENRAQPRLAISAASRSKFVRASSDWFFLSVLIATVIATGPTLRPDIVALKT